MTATSLDNRLSLRPLWVVVLCGGTIMGLSIGIRQTFGLYLDPISESLGLGRETFALAMGLQNLLWGIAAPFAGGIADKFGAGRVIALGTLLYMTGLYCMATASGEAELLSGGVLIGLGISGTGFTVVLGAIGRAAPPSERGRALGLASMGASLGQFAALPYAHAMIEAFGWAGSLLGLALTAGIMVLLGLGIAGRLQDQSSAFEQSARAAFGEAIMHRGFLLLMAGFFVCGFHITFVATHLPAYLRDQDFAPWVGTLALTTIGVANLLGTYVWARVGDAIQKRRALTLLYIGRAVVVLMLLLLPLNTATVVAVSAGLGFLWFGTIPLTSGLVATFFGPRWMSMLFGIVFFVHQLGSFLGAWLGGAVYDLLESYEMMWWLAVALGVLAALLHWPIREEPVARLQPERA